MYDGPKVIKIGAYDWRVELKEGGEKYGEADFETQVISLWPEALTSVSHCVGILLHECLHVIFDNEKLEKLKRNKEEREEQIILGFEAGLVSLFRDNPRLLTWMNKALKEPRRG